ncbi:MAG: hypothetical protein ABIY37_10230, partial [Devosia sp.]
MTKSILFAIALALLPTAGLAETFQFTLKNGYTDAMTGLSVSGGKVEAFKQIPANGKRTFSVTLPDGKCQARVSVTFANGQYHDAGKFDFCQYDLLSI